jgi:hypothetical protein
MFEYFKHNQKNITLEYVKAKIEEMILLPNAEHNIPNYIISLDEEYNSLIHIIIGEDSYCKYSYEEQMEIYKIIEYLVQFLTYKQINKLFFDNFDQIKLEREEFIDINNYVHEESIFTYLVELDHYYLIQDILKLYKKKVICFDHNTYMRHIFNNIRFNNYKYSLSFLAWVNQFESMDEVIFEFINTCPNHFHENIILYEQFSITYIDIENTGKILTSYPLLWIKNNVYGIFFEILNLTSLKKYKKLYDSQFIGKYYETKSSQIFY